MRVGLDIFLETTYKKYRGQRIGLVTNMTGVNQRLISAVDLFFDHPEINLTALFGPEHGIRGDAKEGEGVSSSTDPATGLPVHSLYGEMRKPSRQMLESVDVMVFDLQDIGSRYYTYIYTLAYVMEACADYGKECVVLDRPNPITGVKMEGNLVAADVRSFVGLLPIPNRHGMTVGELAQLFKHEFGYQCELTVVPMEGWQRHMHVDDTGLFWVPPSPNTTTVEMMLLYPGTCLMEGTNLSEGRGTTKPFEWIGAPYIDGQALARRFNDKHMPGVLARPTTFTPTYQKYEQERCSGIQLHVESRDTLQPLKMGVTLIETIAEMYPNDFEFIQNDRGNYFFDLLAGTKTLKDDILKGETTAFFEQCEQQLEQFKKMRCDYLLYK